MRPSPPRGEVQLSQLRCPPGRAGRRRHRRPQRGGAGIQSSFVFCAPPRARGGGKPTAINFRVAVGGATRTRLSSSFLFFLPAPGGENTTKMPCAPERLPGRGPHCACRARLPGRGPHCACRARLPGRGPHCACRARLPGRGPHCACRARGSAQNTA